MTYYGAKELAQSFRTVRSHTIQIAEEIPEEKYAFRPTEGSRSVSETLVHIAIMTRVPEHIHGIERLSSLVSFDFFGFRSKLQAEMNTPRTKAEILELLRTEGESYAKILEGASDDFLGEPVEYPKEMEPRVAGSSLATAGEFSSSRRIWYWRPAVSKPAMRILRQRAAIMISTRDSSKGPSGWNSSKRESESSRKRSLDSTSRTMVEARSPCL